MNKTTLALIFAAGALAAGCKSNEPKPEEAAAAPAPAAAAQQQAPAPTPAKPECPPEDTKAKKKTDKSKSAKNKTAEKPVDCEPAKPAAAAPAAAAPAARAGRLMHGPYDISGNKPVTDISQVQSGQGTMVKGGEITGIPAAGTTFTKLRIGMSRQQAIDTAGPPTDQGAYITGKAWIPFYFGSDRARWEMSYKGKGRLIFSQNAGFGTDFYLTWIIHNDKDTGYR
ncbi:MAG: hypothetical protein MK097_05450 [Dechloromonas sp.]|nr:hypothetical protein [Dechloromonas sp.]